MESATWCRTPPAASAERRLRPEVSKNSSTALSSNEGELARSITTCVPAMASLRPSPVIVLTPVLGEAATTSWPPWRRMATVLEPIRPVPPITTIFIANLPLRRQQAVLCDGCAAKLPTALGTRNKSVKPKPGNAVNPCICPGNSSETNIGKDAVTLTPESAPATLYTTGMGHSPTSATDTAWERTPWHATQRAAWDALKKDKDG